MVVTTERVLIFMESITGLPVLSSHVVGLMVRCLLEPETSRIVRLSSNKDNPSGELSSLTKERYRHIEQPMEVLRFLRSLNNEMQLRFDKLGLSGTENPDMIFPLIVVWVDELDFALTESFVDSLGDSEVIVQQEFNILVDDLESMGSVVGIHMFGSAKGAQRKYLEREQGDTK